MTSIPRPGGVSTTVRVALWMTLTAVSFAGMVTGVRHLSDDLDVLVITFWRNLFAALTMLPFVLGDGLKGLKTDRVALHVGRAVVLVTSQVALFIAMIHLPLGEATALSFTSPFMTALLAWWLLGGRMSRAGWFGLAAGMAGVLVVLRPGLAAVDPVAAVVLLSAALFGFVVVFGKMLAATEPAARLTALLALIAVPLSLVPALFTWTWPSWTDLMWLVAIGIMANGNLYGMARAYRIADATASLPFDFIRLPFVAAFAYVVFGEQTDILTWLGAAIIFAGAVYVARKDSKDA